MSQCSTSTTGPPAGTKLVDISRQENRPGTVRVLCSQDQSGFTCTVRTFGFPDFKGVFEGSEPKSDTHLLVTMTTRHNKDRPEGKKKPHNLTKFSFQKIVYLKGHTHTHTVTVITLKLRFSVTCGFSLLLGN